MAFLFVVHVPYVLPDSKKLGVSNGVRISDESVVSNGERTDELEAVREENEDDNTSSNITEARDSAVSLRDAEMSPIADAKTTESDPVDADKLELDSQEDNAVNKEETVITKLDSLEIDLESSETENKDLEKDKIVGNIDSNHVLKSALSEDFKADKTFEDSNENDAENDEKSITETGRFDVIKVEESEVGVAQQTTSETPELSLDENDDDLQKETSEEAVKNTDEKEEIKEDSGTKSIEEKHLTPLIQVDPIHEQVLDMLNSLGVDNVSQQKVGNKNKIVRISFVKTDSKNCEDILNKLKALGVGRTAGTSISVFPTTVHESYTEEEVPPSSPSVEDDDMEPSNSVKPNEEVQEKESKFKKSIKSRLIVQQVVDSVRGNAEFTFDYLLLIILASLIACMGLVENSSVVLVASMLISPLMGPILAGTFGHVIKVYELRNLGVKSEIKGLLICVLIGFLFGLISGGISLNGAVWGSSDSWPTIEMKSRGMLRSLWVGMLIALPSGAGVAIGILGGNAGSLVGVAISASLLPPAVNAGMLWAYGLLTAIKPPSVIEPVIATVITTTLLPNITTTLLPNITEGINSTSIPSNLTSTTTSPPPQVPDISTGCLPLVNNQYKQVYSCNVSHDAALLGLVSLFLTILNITCIFLMGILVLKIKEVAPETAGTRTDFWHEDVKVARNYYETSKGPSSINLGKKILEEWQKFKQDNEKKDMSDEQKQLKQNVETISCVNYINDLENDPFVQRIMAKLSPSDTTVAYLRDLAQEYQKAKEHVSEQYRKDPSIYLANYQPRARDKTVEKAYHTIHHVSAGPSKPSIAELRSRFKKGHSVFLEDVREGHSDTDISPRRKKKSTGFSLMSPTHSKLFARRKVKFEEHELEEGQKLV